MDIDTTDSPDTTDSTSTQNTQSTQAADSTADDSGITTQASRGPSYGPQQRLHRAGRGRMLGGVAMGVADYFDIDPTLVRVGFVALAFVGGLAVPLYLAGWLLIPDEDTDVSVAEELFAREHSRAW
jgi:phage shock protein PspC (stress-responsive transcriptional regulator)